jgi:hypothetical protein
MNFKVTILILPLVLLLVSCEKKETAEPEPDPDPVTTPKDLVIDHRCTKIDSIPAEWITKAKQNLHIAYGHTSHGSQLTEGMKGLVSFKGTAFAWNNGGTGGALDLHDYAMSGDLGHT